MMCTKLIDSNTQWKINGSKSDKVQVLIIMNQDLIYFTLKMSANQYQATLRFLFSFFFFFFAHIVTVANTVSDPVIEEHFRRSLGKNYKDAEPVSNSVSITGSVDDHFAKALGDAWLQIKAKGGGHQSSESDSWGRGPANVPVTSLVWFLTVASWQALASLCKEQRVMHGARNVMFFLWSPSSHFSATVIKKNKKKSREKQTNKKHVLQLCGKQKVNVQSEMFCVDNDPKRSVVTKLVFSFPLPYTCHHSQRNSLPFLRPRSLYKP